MSVLDLFRLDGKAALVTGAGSGIGRAYAEAMSEAGAADEAEATATATPMTDSANVSDVVATFRAKYGTDDVARYYEKLDVAVEVLLT